MIKNVCAFAGALLVSGIICALLQVPATIAFGPISWRVIGCFVFAVYIGFKV